jgi:hypothetical protein
VICETEVLERIAEAANPKFHAGQKVVCINSKDTVTDALVEGRVYTVSEYFPFASFAPKLCFEEFDGGGFFYAFRFEPVESSLCSLADGQVQDHS